MLMPPKCVVAKPPSKRGQVLTPEVSEALGAYLPLIKSIAADWAKKRNLVGWSYSDWESFFVSRAIHVGGCLDKSRGCMGSLLRVSLNRFGLNALRDNLKEGRKKIDQCSVSLEHLHSLPNRNGEDIPDEIGREEELNQARELLKEFQRDLEQAEDFQAKVAITADFLLGLNAKWLETQMPRQVAGLLGIDVGLAKKALAKARKMRRAG